MAGKYARASAPLARKYTYRIFESKDGTTSVKIVNSIERHNFWQNDLLTKFNRNEIQTKIEKRNELLGHTVGFAYRAACDSLKNTLFSRIYQA